MTDNDLLYIENSNQQKLYYRFTPAAITSNFVPLIVVLDDENKAENTNFEYKMWNVLTPLVWLNKKENPYVQDLLQKLIHQISEDYECEEHIYFYGNSNGAYGAILHAILSKANSVFSHNSNITPAHSNNIDTSSKEENLISLLNSTDSFPIFYLSNSGSMTYFVNACKKNALKFHLDFSPESKINDEKYILKEVLDMFERMGT